MEIVNENKVISTINNEVKTTGSIEVDVIENKDLKVEVQRREYSIVGDDLYIPKRYEDAPQWLRDLISTVTNESFNQKITELNGLSATLNQLIVELEVAKNTYTQSIISSNDIDERINTAVTTLNSSIAQSDATLVNMINTRATPDEASTLALNVLNSSIENGAINALTSSIQNSSVARDQALANDISLVHSEMTGEFEATADAIDSLTTRITTAEGSITVNAEALTQLETEVLDPTTGAIATAVNNVEQSLRTEIENGDSTVESKWAYNSTVELAGVPYSSGFGMVTSASNINGKPASGSEFWISADKFKFTNANNTGAKAPFTIDATGTTPEITFNGKVSFTNVTGYTPPDISGEINSNNDAFAVSQGFSSYADMQSKYSALGKTIINSGYINTGLVNSNSIVANSISADRLMAGTNSSTVWSGGGLISANFNGNPYGNIGSPSQGFRLSSNASGTVEDPNIYGAYIKGSTVDIQTLNVKADGYPSNSGRVVKYQTNGEIYMPGYGSGFLASRVCSITDSAVKVEGWYRAATNDLTAYLQYSFDGSNWTTLISKSAQQYGYLEPFYIYFAELFPLVYAPVTGSVQFRIIGNVSGDSSPILISIYNN